MMISRKLFLLALLLINSVLNASDFTEKQVELLFRSIGHQLLLSGKDSTSRVLPIAKLNELKYQIIFQNKVTFLPDSMIKIVRQNLIGNVISSNYIVNVNECNKPQTVFAFEVNETDGGKLPCSGRLYENKCYSITIEFAKSTVETKYLLWVVLPILLFLLGFFYYKRPKQAIQNGRDKIVPENQDEFTNHNNIVTLGIFQFEPLKNLLSTTSERIELSEKETRALVLLINNDIVLRERFMRELWENEGVIVGNKNLDVLLSKLRKKLSIEPLIKIINIHSKGYKLVLNEVTY
ncbi:MAG: winged helix family transcriptional regulator [Sphingobacteriia bacterium]|nr:MAG: winged helix family transcriptional regulator [Sphingobacteriia bacterium]